MTGARALARGAGGLPLLHRRHPAPHGQDRRSDGDLQAGAGRPGGATGATGASNGARRALAATADSIGYLLRYTGKLSEAETEHRTALAIYQKLADENPAVTGFVSDEAWSHINLGSIAFFDRQAAGGRRRVPHGDDALPETRR